MQSFEQCFHADHLCLPVWHLYYGALGTFVSDRSFLCQIVTSKIERTSRGKRQGFVVTIPFDPTGDKDLEDEDQRLSGNSVRGKYVSVERIKELENGNIDWR